MKEIWKEYPLNNNCKNNYQLFFSNYGRVKSYNSLQPEGKIIKGSLQGGFPIIRISFLKDKTEKQEQKLKDFEDQIISLNEEIKSLGFAKKNAAKKTELRQKRNYLVNEKAKLNKKITKKRRIYVAILIHKAVAELFLPQPQNADQKFIIHKDFDKTNNRVDNLAWASQLELNKRFKKHPKNILFEFKKQFHQEKQVKASKLSENEVLRIKVRLKKGDSLKKLSNQFGVSDMQIHRIKTGENWNHVKLLEELLEEK